MINLNEDQKKAMDLLNDKSKNVALFGSAGVGKSTVIKEYIKNNPDTKVITSTGVAAVLLGDSVNATTFHSFFGIGAMQESFEVIAENASNNQRVFNRIKYTKEIIIDEISMLPGKAFDLANFITKLIKNPDLPFGGIRVIVVGDFYQLGPVSRDSAETDWVFDSYSWQESEFQSIELLKIMRTDDINFINILRKVREMNIDNDVQKFLNSKLLKQNESFEGTRIFSRKNQVNKYNQEMLDKLPGNIITFEASFSGEKAYAERLEKNLPIENPINLKIGAFVMTRVNNFDKDNKNTYVNGTTGYLEQITSQELVIRTIDNKRIYVEKHIFSINDGDGNILAQASVFPVQLAWAITAHKSQGATLDRAIVDLSSGGKWASGLCYTALSRLSNSNGLKILGWNKWSFWTDPKVKKFYLSIKKQI